MARKNSTAGIKASPTRKGRAPAQALPAALKRADAQQVLMIVVDDYGDRIHQAISALKLIERYDVSQGSLDEDEVDLVLGTVEAVISILKPVHGGQLHAAAEVAGRAK